mmetsp:Transcript_44946/g.103951  ORF Transcript_44946/g.103951 Transcript_44946/m.103951 type:complete len:286 (+) Transcript_44946:80-937(+)
MLQRRQLWLYWSLLQVVARAARPLQVLQGSRELTASIALSSNSSLSKLPPDRAEDRAARLEAQRRKLEHQDKMLNQQISHESNEINRNEQDEEMSVEDRRSLEVEAGKLRESREAHRRELLERELNAELDAISSPHVKLPAVGKRTSESAAVGTDTEVGDTDAPSKTRMTDTDTDENRERASSDDDLQTSVGGTRKKQLQTVHQSGVGSTKTKKQDGMEDEDGTVVTGSSSDAPKRPKKTRGVSPDTETSSTDKDTSGGSRSGNDELTDDRDCAPDPVTMKANCR